MDKESTYHLVFLFVLTMFIIKVSPDECECLFRKLEPNMEEDVKKQIAKHVGQLEVYFTFLTLEESRQKEAEARKEAEKLRQKEAEARKKAEEGERKAKEGEKTVKKIIHQVTGIQNEISAKGRFLGLNSSLSSSISSSGATPQASSDPSSNTRKPTIQLKLQVVEENQNQNQASTLQMIQVIQKKVL